MYLSTSQSLDIVLGAAITTNQWEYTASYADDTGGLPLGTSVGTTNSATHVVAISSPSSGSRIVKYLTIYNKDTVEGTVFVKTNSSGTRYIMHEIILAPGETATLLEGGAAPIIYDSNGIIRTTGYVNAQNVGGIKFVPGMWGSVTTKSLTTTSTFAVYLGRLQRNTSQIQVLFRVTTGAATITWAEAGLCSGTPVLNGNASLSLIGSATNVSSIINTTGTKILVFTGTYTAGQHLWFVIGNQATTAGVLRATAADDIQSGISQVATSTRPSTMSTPTAFAVEANTATVIYAAWQEL